MDEETNSGMLNGKEMLRCVGSMAVSLSVLVGERRDGKWSSFAQTLAYGTTSAGKKKQNKNKKISKQTQGHTLYKHRYVSM